MTKKEKVARVYPEKVRRGFLGGVCGCPDDYPFLGTKGENMTECVRKKRLNTDFDCKKCWNEEYKEERKWQKQLMDRFMKVN